MVTHTLVRVTPVSAFSRMVRCRCGWGGAVSRETEQGPAQVPVSVGTQEIGRGAEGGRGAPEPSPVCLTLSRGLLQGCPGARALPGQQEVLSRACNADQSFVWGSTLPLSVISAFIGRLLAGRH